MLGSVEALQPMIDAAVATVLFLLLLATIALPFVAVRRWRGIWRLLAALPLAVLAWMALHFALDVARDPTADNLWPLTLLLWAVSSGIFLAVLWLARRLRLGSSH
jgi:hypothetical protein